MRQANAHQTASNRVKIEYTIETQFDGCGGHAHRHSLLLKELVRVARSIWGARVREEPNDYLPYSTYRPDMAVHSAGESCSTYLPVSIGELKCIDPLSSNPAGISRRGARVALPTQNRQCVRRYVWA